MALPVIMVCDSLAVCQCFRTWIAFDVRMSRLVACVFGSIRRKQISGEFSPRSGRILSHFRSDKFLKIGPSLVACSVVCAPVSLNARMANPRTIDDIVFMVEPIRLTLRVDTNLVEMTPRVSRVWCRVQKAIHFAQTVVE